MYALVQERPSFQCYTNTHTSSCTCRRLLTNDCQTGEGEGARLHMDSSCFCMFARVPHPRCHFGCALVTFAAPRIVCQPRPQALTSPFICRCPVYPRPPQKKKRKRAQGQSSIIQCATTNLCLASNCSCKLRPCNKRVHSNPMSNLLMDLNRVHVSQIDQSRPFFVFFYFAEMKTCFIPTWKGKKSFN